MSGSGDHRGGGPTGSDGGWEAMGKKSKKPGKVGGRQWAPWSSTNATPNTARPAWGGNGSSDSSGTSWAQAPDRGAANRGNPTPPPQTQRPVLTPPLANGRQWQSRPRPPGSKVKKDDAPPFGSDPEVENVDGNNTSDDDDDDLSDDISDYDSDASEKSFETQTTNKWFKKFFKDLNTLSVEQINDQTSKWHCPACKNGPGAIDWYKGLQSLMTHARSMGSTRVRLHRELAALLEEELSRRGPSVVPAGEQVGKWKGLRESTDREIVWPPMVIVMNTFLEKDDDDKWKGMGNQELVDYFREYAPTKARHAYGPSGHRGMSVLIFEGSAVGYMEAERLHRHFVNQGTDRNAWHLCKVRFAPGGKRQLFGFLASKEDMEAFNKHCHGKSRLKYEMRSYNEMVVMQMKHMTEDNQQLNYLNNKMVKREQRSKTVEETLGVVTQKLREKMEENIFVRSKAKEKHLVYKEETKSQEDFFHSQIEDIHQATEEKEKRFEKLLQKERSKARRFDVDSGTTEDCKLRKEHVQKFIDCQVRVLATPRVSITSHETSPPHLRLPVSVPAAAEVDPQPPPPAAVAKPHEVMYRTKVVNFFGHYTPIVYQNVNGPCSLLAICNVLLLKNVIRLNLDASKVSQKELLSLLTGRLLNLKSSLQDKDDEYVHHREQKIMDAIGLLSHLTTDLDVNVMFTKIDDFEFTRECAIFDLLDIPLYHGWIVDPQDTETAIALGSMSYNILACKVADFKSGIPTEESKHVEEELQGTLTSKEPGDHQPAASLIEADKETCSGHFDLQIHGRCLLDKATEHHCDLIDNFLENTANQLTVHGLFCLHEGVKERELCVFFYNSHLNTMIKYKGSLYLLATDKGFISQTDLVWQKLDEVKGDGAFFDSNFKPFKAETPTNDSWNDQQAMTSTDDYCSQFDNSISGRMDGPNADLAKGLYTLPPFGRKEKRRFTLPINLFEILKPHQKQGIEWLWSLHCSDMPGGIVADDMGLGKTLQTTTFLSGLFYSNLIESVLIIVPLSILDSWIFELNRCGLKRMIQIYNSTEDKGFRIVKELGGILLISYTLYLHNFKKFASPNKKWSYVLLDEAHKIKNMKALITEAVEEIKCDKKVLLSGTPMPRDLMDIFSLMTFVNKDVFGDKGLFKKNYMNPIEMGKFSNSSKKDKNECVKALAKCRRKLSQYVLRRSKSVLVESGDLACKKHDIIVWLGLSQCQVDLYTKFCELYLPLSDPFHPEKKQSFTKTLICQYICNDPGNLLHIRDSENCGSVIRDMAVNLLQATNIHDLACSHHSSSSKISFVLDLVKELFDQESLDKEVFERRKKGVEQWKKVKVLIFSQHIFMLHRIKEHLKDIIEEDDMILIDGTTPKEDRYESIKNFDSENGPRVFFLTARVGGEGLTLTAATKAIIVDPSWNLSDDNQIADRIYRIGQNHDVTIYRLFTCGTVDEHAYKLQLLKGNLSQAVLDGKLPASLVKKEDSKVLKVPTKGFNWSETQHLIKRVIGDRMTLGGKAESFLRKHPLVFGLTSQNDVFSKVEISLSDIKYDESDDENVTEKEKPFMYIGKSDKRRTTPWSNRLRSHEPTNSAKPQGVVSDTAIWREIDIPANKVGMLIGRDGNTIKNIRLKSSALISPDDRRANPSSPFKCVKIWGTLKEFKKAKMLIFEAISKTEEVEDYLSVPIDKVGLIIGTGARKKKEREEITGAHINFISAEKNIKIRGATHKVVEDAKRRILDVINRNRQRHPDDGRARQGPPRARSPQGK